MFNDLGYFDAIKENIEKVMKEQEKNIELAASAMADAIEQDKLINVYGGGGHTTLCVGEMFFRAGGLCNINPVMETALSVFNQALKYLELERTVNFGASVVKYYDLKEGDLLIVFHNIGINAATIDAVAEAKKRGVKIIAVSSSYWQNEMPADHFIRHPSGKNLFDFADICIDDYNPVGDAVVSVDGCDTPIAPISNAVDFYIIHALEIATIRECVRRGIVPPVWKSANTPGGDEFNKANMDKYKPRIKML